MAIVAVKKATCLLLHWASCANRPPIRVSCDGRRPGTETAACRAGVRRKKQNVEEVVGVGVDGVPRGARPSWGTALQNA